MRNPFESDIWVSQYQCLLNICKYFKSSEYLMICCWSVLALEILDSAGVRYVWYRYSNQRIMIIIPESNANNMVILFRNSRHPSSIMMTSSNGNIFLVTGLCEGNSPVTDEFPSQSPMTRSFDVSLICALNKRLSKQSWGWRMDTTSRSLWRHCNVS